MSRRSLDHAELHTVDASRSPLHKSLYDVHVADVGAYEQTDVGHEMGNVDHSYDQLGYSRERSEMKSMDKNAARPLHGPMPKGSAYNATGRVPSASTGFNTSYNAGGRKRVTMKDMLAVDIDLSIESPSHPAFQPNRTAAMAPKPPLCNHRKSVDSAIGLRYHRNGADEVFYSANNVPPYMHSPTEHVRPVHLYSEIPSHATNARDLPYISRPVNDMSVSDRQYANRTAYKNVNADQRTTLVGRDEDGDSSTSGRKDSRENARMDLPESKPMARLTKGRSTVDNVTENILRKMLLLCEKGNDQSWDGEDFTSAKILFKRVLLVQIQAMGYILADICANDGMLAAAHLWADQMSRSSHLKTRSKGNDVIHGDHSLLALQKVAYETGMSTFDVLLSMRHTLLDRLQMPIFGGIQQTQSTMRMACVGGFPGCAAIAIRLFFMMTSPALDLQVEDWGRPQDGSRHIVEEIRLRGVEWVGVDEGENAMDLLRKNVSKIKYYRLLLIMLDCTAQRDTRSLKFPAIGRKKYNEADDTWRKMWDEVAESALPGTVMVVYQRAASGRTSWEDIAPSVGPWHFQAPTHLQHCVRIGRK
ncbi:hypothetical protein KP509_19G060600 [Ceratopteris richardii]|uniref:Uncharacterized protein n=1 Tax=Ceratopteris richardii TaxID=49495 RepID=A0A8T2SMT8_CERRI|nr:hypothetical protein KP509_19G060600 [Ceratopteris richardii]